MNRKWIAVAIFLLTALLFLHTGAYGFLNWDDNEFVTANFFVRQGLTAQSVQWALTTNFVYWQPLIYLSHMTMVSLFGMNGGPHHLLNVLLHAINATLWFLILCRLRFAVWTAAIATVLFAWHPLRAESVAWISERKDVLSGLFWLLTILAYIHYAQLRKDWRRYALVLILFALALAAKPVAVTLPVLFLLLDYWPLNRLDPSTLRARLIEKIPLLALSAGSALITIAGQDSSSSLSTGLSLPYLMANAVRSYAIYVKQTAWPEALAPFYALPNPISPVEVVFSAALLAALSWFAWKSWRRSPWWAVAWLWYLITLLPNCGIIQVGQQAHADRYTYLPTTMLIAGVCFGIHKGLDGSPQWQRTAAIGGLVLSAIFFLWTTVQSTYWKDEFELYGRVLEIDPNVPIAYNNLGQVLAERGKHAEAIRNFEQAAALYPAYTDARTNAASSYLSLGQPARALPHVERAVADRPDKPEGYLHLGRTLIALDRLEEAKLQLQKGIALVRIPDRKALFFMQLGIVDYVQKNDAGALVHFRAALKADPTHWPAVKNAGIVLGNMGRVPEAIAELESYKKAVPEDTSVQSAIDALRAITAPGK
jgi:tetratricopeptide (TPR) repeat protein